MINTGYKTQQAKKLIDEALKQLNAKRYSSLKLEKDIEEVEKSNLSVETKGFVIASLKSKKSKIESIQTKYYLEDDIKENLIYIISLEDECKKFTEDILKKIIVSYGQIEEYKKFVSEFVVTKAKTADKKFHKVREKINNAVSVLKPYLNYDEYRSIEFYISNNIPEHPQEILIKLDKDLVRAKINSEVITHIINTISDYKLRPKFPIHFKEANKKVIMVGNYMGLSFKK